MVVASLVDSLSKIGAIGGIISFVGVGLMILLVAAQSRQIRAMREWIDAEPERQAEVASRVIAEVQRRIAAARERRAAQAAGQPVPPVPGVPPARKAPPAPGTLGATPEARAVAAARASDSTSAAPEGGSVPPPAPGVEGAPGEPPVFAPLTPAGDDDDDADETAVLGSNGSEPVLDALGQPIITSEPGQETQPADALPDDYDPLGAATPAARAADPRFADDHFSLDEDYEDEEPRGNRVLFGVGAAALVAGIVIAGFVLFGGGGSDGGSSVGSSGSSGDQASQSDGGDTGSGQPKKSPAASTVDPASVRVTVLNGTTVNGLAQSITDKLSAKDYTVGQPNTLSSDTTVATSMVEYRQGTGNLTKARQVAKELGIDAGAVQPIDANVSAAAPDTADVVVVTGQDLAGSATSGTTG